jgi:hypothetical protein
MFYVFTAAKIQVVVLRVVTPYGDVEGFKRFLHLLKLQAVWTSASCTTVSESYNERFC